MTTIVPLDYRKLSFKPLFLDYLHRHEALSAFFAGNPFDAGSWRAVAGKLDERKHPRTEVAAALDRLNRDLGADEAALGSVRALADGALAIVTGQQVGILGGPLYTLYKAITAVDVAREASARLGRPVVPLFWMDTDDHDFDEVRNAYLLDGGNVLVQLRYDASDADRRVPVGGRKLEAGITAVLDAAAAALPTSEFKDEITDIVAECYRPGRSLADAFGSLLLRLTRDTGLAVVDPSSPNLKKLAVDLFRREIREAPESSEIVRTTTERLIASGYHGQASSSLSQLNLFYAKPERHPILIEDGKLRLSPDEAWVGRDEAERRAAEEPESFSPNVLLRPLYQDTILPTLSYVAGPNELAYFAQLKEVYSRFGVTMPLLTPRASLTVVERPQARFLERYEVDLTRLQSNDESLLNEILRRYTPPQLEEDLARARSCIQEITNALERDLEPVDPTLVPTVASTRGKLLHHLKELEAKALRGVKRKNETVRSQFLAARTALFPGFDLQERKLSPLVFFNRYGSHFPGMVREGADPSRRAHLLLYP